MAASTERDVIGKLRGVYTLEQLYALVAATPATDRSDGQQVVHGVTDTSVTCTWWPATRAGSAVTRTST
jgi:hypothetical protein